MAYSALPQLVDERLDGQLAITPLTSDPIVCILGTATQGDSETLTLVNRVTTSASAFGREGTLVRGLYEVAAAGGKNIRLYRIGATPARLAEIGGGITLETVACDDTAGTQYTLFWDDTVDRLRVWRAADGELVYDNNPTYPALKVDLGEVSVTGTASGVGDIGSLAVPLTMEAADGVSGAVYTAGTDGVSVEGVSAGLCRMRMFECLYNAYQLLENEDLDLILPQDVYLDDLNVNDLTTAQIATLGLSALSAYPVAGSSTDVLGTVFVQEYEGENYFWWDVDRDGIAEIYTAAGVGAATLLLDANGNSLVAADFHEANFGYQLARFCFSQSTDNEELLGYIGTRPPSSFSAKDISAWIGQLPVHAEDTSGDDIISLNGSGLLGNKWVAGRLGNVGTGLLPHTIDGVAGRFGGGFIATDTEWSDGTQQKDDTGHLVDIGKFLSLVPPVAILANPYQTRAYYASGCASYVGLDASLPANTSATNKVVPGVRLPFRIKNSKLDALAERGFVMFQAKPKGIVVADAPTAARDGSDWRRQSTMKIIKAVVDGLRMVADPFLGETLLGVGMAALETAIDRALGKFMKTKYIRSYQKALTSTASQAIQGEADLALSIVPAFELRRINTTIALRAS